MSTEVLVLGFDCVPSFSSGEVFSRRARVQSQVERSEPEGNLDGFLARLQDSRQNEGKSQRESAPPVILQVGGREHEAELKKR